MNPSTEYLWLRPNIAFRRSSTACTSMGSGLVTITSRAMTAFVSDPSRTASRASATAAR